MNKIYLAAFADEAGEDFSLQLKALKRNDLQGIEIRSVEGENVGSFSLDKARELKKRMEDAGIVCRSIGSPIGKISIDRAGEHARMLEHIAEIAHILGAENVRMFSYFMKPDEETMAFENRVIDELGMLQRIAKAEGITLCHENEKGIFGWSPENCLKIHSAIPQIRAVFDPANYVQCGVDTLRAWDMLKDKVRYFHAKDALPSGKVVPCGAGAGHVPDILSQYLAMGGSMITLEPHLFSFSALKTLEENPEKRNDYATADEAFDAAAQALKAIIRA